MREEKTPGDYSFILDGWRPRPVREIGGLPVKSRETCPECGRELVNIYYDGNRWKCKKCMDGGPATCKGE